MSSLAKLQAAKSLDDLAAILGYKPAALAYLLYHLPDAQKYTAFTMRWFRLLGQVGDEVKLIPDVIMPPVWSSDHGGHAPHDLVR
ncbi:hypothetical protein AEB_P0402 [Altererythrobacter sp. B11]|nr:hypothetical protein AEB_P0402 [Altererythrobacter sp. B11]